MNEVFIFVIPFVVFALGYWVGKQPDRAKTLDFQLKIKGLKKRRAELSHKVNNLEDELVCVQNDLVITKDLNKTLRKEAHALATGLHVIYTKLTKFDCKT